MKKLIFLLVMIAVYVNIFPGSHSINKPSSQNSPQQFKQNHIKIVREKAIKKAKKKKPNNIIPKKVFKKLFEDTTSQSK